MSECESEKGHEFDDDELEYDENAVAEEYELEEGDEDAEMEGEDEEEEEDSGRLEVEFSGDPCNFEFHVHESGEPVFSIDFLPGTDLLASGGGDDRAVLLDAAGFEQLADLGRFGDSVACVKFSRHSQEEIYLAAGSLDGTIRVWTTSSTEGLILQCSLEGPSPLTGEDEASAVGVTWLDWHPRGSVLVAGFEDGSVWIWQCGGSSSTAGSVMAVFSGLIAGSATEGFFTPDGRGVLVGGEDGSVLLLSPKDSSVTAKLAAGQHFAGPITRLALNAQNLLVVGDGEGALKAFKVSGSSGQWALVADLAARSEVESLESVEGLAFHPLNQTILASASMSGDVLVWNVQANCSLRHRLQEEELVEDEGWTLIRWLPGFSAGSAAADVRAESAVRDSILLAGSSQGRLVLFDALAGKRLAQRQLRGRPGVAVLDAAWNESSKTLAAAFEDGSIALYQYQ